MQKSYIDYAMSVIVSRALPDVRDGLKPVQRRTLYDMRELGIRWDTPYRKCARIVGDTMGKYHPHGDSSIYEALVVMAQDFKKGRILVDGHGNFGSIEGDGAAAMRYTEARLTKFAQEVYLGDLDKDIVDFLPNFDETEREPEVLPVRIPNLLVNGAEGIAVGMATSVPPHNLGEVIDAVKAYMRNDKITTAGLMKYMPGPDFPTGGIVINKDELPGLYETGQGKIRIRGKVELEKAKGGRERLVITEIPYTMIGTGIGRFLNDVASLVESRKTTDILDISNQSSKEGIRIVLEVRKGADIEKLKNLLYSKTRLEDTFGVNMLAVDGGKPETLGLKAVIERHVDFQFDMCTRKYTTLLRDEREKSEIQQGLIEACDIIDLIIEILRGSKNLQQAKDCLMAGKTDGIRFKSAISRKMAAMLRFTERQAKAILEMRLYKLIGLELDALTREHEKTLANIARYEDILNNYDSMAKVIMDDLTAIRREFSSGRKTVIENGEEAVFVEEGPKEQEVFFLMDRFGYAKTIDRNLYEKNKETIEEEYRHIFPCMNTGRICIFSDSGEMHLVRVDDLPFAKLKDKGVPIDNVSNYDSSRERILFISDRAALAGKALLFVSTDGLVKRVEASEFDVGKRTTAATKLADGESLVAVAEISEESQLILESENGYYLRFKAEEIPYKKKAALGVRGMRLASGDRVSGVYLFDSAYGESVHIGEANVPVSRFKPAKRDGKGTKIKL